jgi:NhaP-type Na+/H+ or K+/H+ antiporter
LHESVVAIGLGAIFGLVFVLVMHNDIEFSDEIFFTFILPPIIFAAGYNLRKLHFFENIGIICFLGAIGTLLCFIVLCTLIGVVDHFIFGQILSTKEVMLLSSVLCATDTVAALSLIKQ